MNTKERIEKLKLKFQSKIYRTLCAAVLIYSLLPLVPLRAQNIPINPYVPPVRENNSLGLLHMKIDIFAIPFSSRSRGRLLQLKFEDYADFIRNLKKEAVYAPINHKVFNTLYNKPKVDEKKMLREAWKKAFGIDLWYPYYKAKEVEKWIKKKMSIKIFKLKGEPEFSRNQILYTLKTKF